MQSFRFWHKLTGFLGLFLLVWTLPSQGKDIKKFSVADLKKPYLTKKGHFNVKKYKGKAYIVDFWASWCEPCKKAMPELEALYKKHRKDGLVIIGINVDDDPKKGREFLKKYKVSFPTVYDKGKKLVTKAGVSTMPSSFVLNRRLQVTESHQGFRGDETVKEYRAQIAKLLGKKRKVASKKRR